MDTQFKTLDHGSRSIRIFKENCQKETGLDFKIILELSGILGIHTEEEVVELSRFSETIVKRYFICSLADNTIWISAVTNLLIDFNVIIDFPRQMIRNDGIRAREKGCGVGKKRLRCQVPAALQNKFSYIRLMALRDTPEQEDTDHKSIGYIIWGKYGFIMSDDDETIQFLRLMDTHNRMEKKLFDLLFDATGEKIWKKFGFTWTGVFVLEDEHECLKNFKKVVMK